jgi:hypothetical protein
LLVFRGGFDVFTCGFLSGLFAGFALPGLSRAMALSLINNFGSSGQVA